MRENRQTSYYSLLDFSKAFDKVNHSKLLWKLHQYGIRGHVLDLVRAFLGSRSQQVVFDGEESESVPVTSGIPQGSVLGPILFLIYINDLPDEVSSQVRLFADDTALYLTIESEDHGSILQNDLDLLSRWDTRWDMEFKVVHGLVAVPLPDYIQYSNRISRYCHSMTFRQVSTSTDYYKYSFFPLAIVQWNALPSLLHACRASRSLRPQSASCNTLALRSQFSCFYLILANLNYS